MSDTKPREFWIHDGKNSIRHAKPHELVECYQDFIHVIEYSALEYMQSSYDDLNMDYKKKASRVEELEREVARVVNLRTQDIASLQEAQKKLAIVEARLGLSHTAEKFFLSESEKLQAELERVKAKLDDQKKDTDDCYADRGKIYQRMVTAESQLAAVTAERDMFEMLVKVDMREAVFNDNKMKNAKDDRTEAIFRERTAQNKVADLESKLFACERVVSEVKENLRNARQSEATRDDLDNAIFEAVMILGDLCK